MFVLYLIVFVGLTGVGIIIPLFPFFGEQVGATPAQITMLMALFAAGQFVASPFWGWLSDRIGRRPVFILTLAGGAASYIILGIAETVPALYLARVFGGLMAGNVPVAFAAAADMTGGGRPFQSYGTHRRVVLARIYFRAGHWRLFGWI